MPEGLSSMKMSHPLNSRRISPCGSKNVPGFSRSFINHADIGARRGPGEQIGKSACKGAIIS